MNRIKAFGAFWYDFVIGDDWQVAAFVVAGLALTASCAHAAGVNAWWLLPLFVFAALAWSLHRATKSSRPLCRTVPAFPLPHPPHPPAPPRTGPAPPPETHPHRRSPPRRPRAAPDPPRIPLSPPRRPRQDGRKPVPSGGFSSILFPLTEMSECRIQAFGAYPRAGAEGTSADPSGHHVRGRARTRPVS
jgi:hypothetical protein